MANYDNTNSGALFKNDRKEKETHPDYKGSININGVDYWLSAWLKIAKDGAKFMSLSVQKKEQKQTPKPSAGGGSTRRHELDDDVPF